MELVALRSDRRGLRATRLTRHVSSSRQGTTVRSVQRTWPIRHRSVVLWPVIRLLRDPTTRLKQRVGVVGVIALGACLLGGCGTRSSLNSGAGEPNDGAGLFQGVVTDVIDGDTIAVEFGAPFEVVESIRLLGIDTPEKPGGPRPPECGGTSATEYTQAALPAGTAVWVARDVETRDVYGRLLAWIVRSEDGTNINLAIVEAGHATALSIAPNHALRSEVSVAADRARSEKRGFWAECGGLPYPLSENE